MWEAINRTLISEKFRVFKFNFDRSEKLHKNYCL